MWYRDLCFLALVQESGSFQTTQKVPKKSDFWEKSDFSNHVPKHAKKMKKKSGAQEIRFLGKIGFLKPCPSCPRNPIFWGKIGFVKPCPRYPRNPIFWKIGFLKPCVQTYPRILFFGKIGFFKPCQSCPRNPIFLEK
jgi:hypothetical protein